MCRIFGQFGDAPIEDMHLHAAALSMKHGGPDRQNYNTGEKWALGNDRLAIQGIAGGDQPFTNVDGICVVFNGEIYNHNALRSELRQRGFKFTDTCDGNVIAPLYQLYGPDFVKYLDGMYAIAIVDTRKEPVLHAFSDPAAMKSVYYHWNERTKTLSFASEVEALALLTQEPLAIEPRKVYDYLSLRAVCGEETIFRNISTLGPSRHLQYELGKEPRVATYQTAIISFPPDEDLPTAGLQLRQLLNAEVRQMMASDVPACVVTSGGLDSTFLSALAKQYAGKELHSFHVCYKGNWPHDERRYASEAAQQFGTVHHEVELDPDTFPDLILRMTGHIGQPNTAPHSLSTYCLFQGIHEAGFRVAITGEGADEFFAGYERFGAALAPGNEWIEGYLDKFGPFPAKLRGDVLTPDFHRVAHVQQTRVEEFIDKITRAEAGAERLNALQALDQWERFPYYILRRADHLSMAHAIEMRVPFCQPRIMDFARQLPVSHRLSDGKSKRVVYEAARGLIPDSVMTRKKQPFTLPITAMITEGTRLFDFVTDTLQSGSFHQRGYFDVDKVLGYCRQQGTAPRDDVANMLWSAMALELWQQRVDKINLTLGLRSKGAVVRVERAPGSDCVP